MKKVLCLSVALICLASALTSCSLKFQTSSNYESDNEKVSVVTETVKSQKSSKDSNKTGLDGFYGKWQCEELETEEGKTDNLWGADAFTLFQIEINKDNTGSFFSFLTAGFLGSEEPLDIKWEKKDENTITFTVIDPYEGTTANEESLIDEDEVMTLIKDSDKLILDMSDDMSVFKAYLAKVDNFTPIPEDTEMSFDLSIGADTDIDLSDENSYDFEFEIKTEPTSKAHLNIY